MVSEQISTRGEARGTRKNEENAFGNQTTNENAREKENKEMNDVGGRTGKYLQ